MPGHDKLVADIRKVVEDVVQPMEKRLEQKLMDHFNKGFEELKQLITGNRPPSPRP